jgi:hypothetical protein
MHKIESDEPKNHAMVLLKILALRNGQIEEGKVQSAAVVIQRLREHCSRFYRFQNGSDIAGRIPG